MDFKWMKFPQVAEIFDAAAEFAKDDRSSLVTAHHLLLSLLRFDSVWESFSSPEEFRERFRDEAQDASDRMLAPDASPEWESKFRKDILTEAERLRRESGEALPQPHHFAEALFEFGGAKLREVMEKFDFGKRDRRDDGHLPENDAEALACFTVELTAAAKKGTRRVSGRREETDALMRTLVRCRKCCPVLVGRPGVGKTAAVEILAQRIADGDVPEAMKNAKIYSLNTGALIAGASFYGQYEGRLRAVVDAVKRQPGGILFVDELHALMTSGGGHQGNALTVGNLLKPELAGGELRFIGATTEDEYRRFIEADGALERRFTPIQVREPNRKECLEILRECRSFFEDHYRAKFPDRVLERALDLSCRFIPRRGLPDKVFDVLDEAGADHLLNGVPGGELEAARVDSAVARIARLPHLPEAAADRLAPLRKLNAALKRRIFGQDAAIGELDRAVKLAESGLGVARAGTRGAFFFNGSTGVGKTALARTLADALSIPLVKFDMSEYAGESAVARLVGAAPGLVGYDEGGALVNAVCETPHCVLLMDEIEKAHPAVHRLLLQVMDEGVLTDNRGRRADFRQVYLIFTGNVKTVGGRRAGFDAAPAEEREALAESFPPEFRSRLTAVVEFNALSEETLGRIVDAAFAELTARAAENGIAIALEDSARTEFVRRAAAENAGARPVARLVERFAALPLAEHIIGGRSGKKLTLAYRMEKFRYR